MRIRALPVAVDSYDLSTNARSAVAPLEMQDTGMAVACFCQLVANR